MRYNTAKGVNMPFVRGVLYCYTLYESGRGRCGLSVLYYHKYYLNSRTQVHSYYQISQALPVPIYNNNNNIISITMYVIALYVRIRQYHTFIFRKFYISHYVLDFPYVIVFNIIKSKEKCLKIREKFPFLAVSLVF